jgi:Na+-translocating ferredoxin:NAD+ oxidoreductase RNF subunit RnfB
MQTAVLTAIIALSALALFSSFLLAMVARAFAVPSNPKVEEIEGALPGANCGGCGLPGCSELARRIAGGNASVDACPVGGDGVASKIAAIMGASFAGGAVRRAALVLCAGDDQVAEKRFHYNGIRDCTSAAILFGGDKACSYGCLGLGTCAGVCQFDALHMLPNGLPEIDPVKCTACGKCVTSCPKNIIKLVPVDKRLHILCSSHDKGAKVRKICAVGCIGCTKCVKEAPEGAIAMQDNLAVVNYDFDIPDTVAAACPMNTIQIKVMDGSGEEAEVKAAAGGEA